MQYRRLQHTLDGADANSPMRATRMGRLVLSVVVFIVSGRVVQETWGGTAVGDVTAPTAAGMEQSLQEEAPSTVQGIPLPGLPAFKHYWVGNSSIPGAGLGVFARTHLPAGTIWNPEDAEIDNTIAITLRQWQALIGLQEHLQQAGHSDHPFTTLRAFFDEYPYICKDLYFIASLTGTTFTNHAPTAPAASNQQQHARAQHRKLTSTTAAQQAPRQQKSAGSRAAAGRGRFANSGDVSPEMAAIQGFSEWQECTLAATLRDVQAGEELLEDYAAFNTPCTDSHSCPDFLQRQQQQAGGNMKPGAFELPPDEWNRAVLVQSLDVYVGNSSSPGGGLGVFAARDLPAGTVWNKEDAAHALVLTRRQWITLYRLHTSLAAAHASKPVIAALVHLLQTQGIYCPLDDCMYLPLSRSLLARQAAVIGHLQGSSNKQAGSSSSSSNSSRDVAKQEIRQGQQAGANSRHIADGDSDAGTAVAAGGAARCTWLQTAVDMRKGEELVVDHSQQHKCDWPGFQLSTL